MERTPKNPQKMVNIPQNSKGKSQAQGLKVFVRTRPVIKSEFGKETAITCDPNVTKLFLPFLTTLLE
jgi:hypothetical protein